MLSNNDHAKVNKVLYEFEHALQRGKISTFIDYAVENNLLWIKVEGKGLMIELERRCRLYYCNGIGCYCRYDT